MKVYFIENGEDSVFYNKLMVMSMKHCNEILFVTRPSLEINYICENLLSDLQPYLTHVDAGMNWPGTSIFGEYATLYYHSLCKETIEILELYSDELTSWIQPRLPEDLCLMKTRDEPWLVSTTHENLFYFSNLTQNEITNLSEIGIKLKEEIYFP